MHRIHRKDRGSGEAQPFTAQTLADALSQLADCPESRQTMGAAARRAVERHYSTETVLESLLAIYRRQDVAVSRSSDLKIDASQ